MRGLGQSIQKKEKENKTFVGKNAGWLLATMKDTTAPLT